jgi:type III secretion system FlhB-like substrate exporter
MSGLLEVVELDATIPPHFYLAVAEILAFVYRLNEK